jgi:hypothetical protein
MSQDAAGTMKPRMARRLETLMALEIPVVTFMAIDTPFCN